MRNQSDSIGRPAAHVVLADDDREMRSLLASVLRAEGYRVIEASDGWDLFWSVETAERDAQIDLVVSDARMPGYRGLDVAEAWAEAGSGPRVVLMSGFPDDDIRVRADALGVALLEKPFDMDRFRSLVRDQLMIAHHAVQCDGNMPRVVRVAVCEDTVRVMSDAAANDVSDEGDGVRF